MLTLSQKQRLERQKRMRDSKEKNTSDWSPQQKANFNKNMRRKLKEGLRGLSDMVLLLENLPPTVLENAKLTEDLPKVIEFVDAFLEKAGPLPVAEHVSGELRTFRSYAVRVADSCGLEDHVKIINGEKYLIESDSCTALPIEIHRADILKKHASTIQRYIDPSIVIIDDQARNRWSANDPRVLAAEVKKRSGIKGDCHASANTILDYIPTNPPCAPHIIVSPAR